MYSVVLYFNNKKKPDKWLARELDATDIPNIKDNITIESFAGPHPPSIIIQGTVVKRHILVTHGYSRREARIYIKSI